MSEICRFEPDVIRAAADDRWTDSLRRHLDSCEHCAASAAVAPWIHRFSKIGDREHRLPDPSFVWLKAQLLQGSAEAARVTRPLNVAQFLAYISVAGGWAALLTWKWTVLATWLHSFTPAGLVQSAAQADSMSIPFIATLLVLASITITLALHTILAEE